MQAHWTGVLEGEFTFATIVFLLGGGFLMYTAIKEVAHLLSIDHLEADEKRAAKSTTHVIVDILQTGYQKKLATMRA